MTADVIVVSEQFKTPKRYRQWIECADARHATDGPRVWPGDEVVTLCGKTVIVIDRVPGKPAPECPACDRRWREIEGIEQRESHVPWTSVPTSRAIAHSVGIAHMGNRMNCARSLGKVSSWPDDTVPVKQ